jgi:hypothetical protein
MKRIFIILIIGSFFIKNPLALAVERTSPITVAIHMSQDIFSLPEPVAGQVILTNMGLAIPAVFDVSLFLNGISQQSFTVSFRSVLSGTNSFSLKDFSIDQPWKTGQWRIVIKQQNLDDDQAATADFVVRPSS